MNKFLRKRIAEKDKEVNASLRNLRQTQEALTELETLQSFLADITGEETDVKSLNYEKF